MKIFLVRLSWDLPQYENVSLSEFELITAGGETSALIAAAVLNAYRHPQSKFLSESIVEVVAEL